MIVEALPPSHPHLEDLAQLPRRDGLRELGQRFGCGTHVFESGAETCCGVAIYLALLDE